MSENVKVALISIAILCGIFGLVGGYKYLQNQDQMNQIQNTSSPTPDPAYSPSDTQSAAAPTPASGCWTASQSWNEIGQNGCVQFTVGYTYVSSKCNGYLDQTSVYSSGFSAWIPDSCGLGETLTSKYSGKTVDVSGTITQYDGAPEIQVTSASQVLLAN